MSDNTPWLNTDLPFQERAQLLLNELTYEEKLDQLNYRNKGIPRLGLNDYVWWNEALHGLARSGAATVFPQAIGLAATFSPEIIKGMGRIIALEGRARHHESLRKGDYGTYKGLTYWSPNVNIFRDPRWGRGHETYGEDPFLAGLLGEAYIQGVQGDHDTYVTAVATPKHYAVHSGPELTRLSFDSVADERDLRETYLPAFKRCFKAGALSVMTAYNAYNGEPCATNDYLVNQILRDEWGFEGAVVTDAGAGEALYKEHKAVKDYPEATAKELSRGIDVIVDWEQGVHEADQRSILNKADVDRAVLNQLFVKFKLGFFDADDVVPLAQTPYEVIECPEHLEAAEDAMRKALVLLKNQDNLLPLDASSLNNVAVIGPNADSKEVLLGNYFGTPSRYTTVLRGIQDAVGADCRVWYAKGCEYVGNQTEACAEPNDRYAEAVSVAERSDVVILCLGLDCTIEGEAGDTFNAEAGGDRLSIELHEAQETLIEKVLATGKPVIALTMLGSSINSPLLENSVDAHIHCWYPGAEGGKVIAETIFGENNPSGKLPVTFYRNTEDLPAFDDYTMENRTYKFFAGTPVYPFGFGLSYTQFTYNNAQVEYTDEGINVQVDINNTGENAGDEVVQVYLKLDRDFRTPLSSLVGTKRVHLLGGETQSVKIFVENEYLASILPDGSQEVSSGPASLFIGGSQPDARSTELLGQTPIKLNFIL
ncbi:MAG: glycoside hydrolase family 3 C-terminal domain-containing protein [Lentisphaeria bacterium]|nr:glycoside hydrolase family 3 C-terminal domain-containing protein [Lentisphaeria bacterium]